ncbi:MAG: hypothetical protein C0625_04190 [Arcobacter sp.]|mgnify:CR=1 FL=1|nr:MAG: hypothetical protein C0625_04190 [Arcobacter sp.]
MSKNNISKISELIKEDDYTKLIDNEIDHSIATLEEILNKEKVRETLITTELSNKKIAQNVYTFDLLDYLDKTRENILNLENYLENLSTKKRLLGSKKRLSFS